MSSYLTNVSSRTSIKALNIACGTGMERPYTVMPFFTDEGVREYPQDVSDKDVCVYCRRELIIGQHDLPLLTNITEINQLDDEDLNRYLDLYQIPRPGNTSRETKFRELRAFIGSTVSSA